MCRRRQINPFWVVGRLRGMGRDQGHRLEAAKVQVGVLDVRKMGNLR